MTASTDDLRYIRELAEAGQSAPLLGGRFLAWWGGLATLAYVGHYLIGSGTLGVGFEYIGYMWIAFMVLGLGGQFLMAATLGRSKPGAASTGNRVSSTVWMAAGMVLFAFFAGVVAKSIVQGGASDGFNWSIPLVLGVYGISQLVSGVMANNRALVLAGWTAIASVALAAFMVGKAELYLVAALAACLTVFVPGIAMIRNEPSEIV